MSASQHRIYFLLQRAAHQMKKDADAALKDTCGLTTAQAAALGIIVREGPVTQKQIALALGQRESAITTMAQRLVDAGFVTRSPSERDARAWSLAATPGGSQALKRSTKAFRGVNQRIDDAFSSREVESLARGLKRLLDE